MSCGLSAPKWRTVRSTIPQTHPTQLRLWTNFKIIGRTVRSKIADRSQFNSAKPPEATTPLDKFLISTADCPALLGGPSAVHSANSTRDDNVSGHNSRIYGGLSALQ